MGVFTTTARATLVLALAFGMLHFDSAAVHAERCNTAVPENIGESLSFRSTIDPPIIAASIPDTTLTLDDLSLKLKVSHYFDKGLTLTYEARSSDPATATVDMCGSMLTITLLAVGTTTVEVTASDGAVQTFTVTVNQPPTVTPIPDQTLGAFGSSVEIDLSHYFDDPEGERLTYEMEFDINPGSYEFGVIISDSLLTIMPRLQAMGTVTVTATDPHNSPTSDTFSVTVEPNEPPTCDQISDRTLNEGEEVGLQLWRYCSDDTPLPPLTYSATSLHPETASVSISNRVLTIRALAVGTTTVKVTVEDFYGASHSLSFGVTVNERPPCDQIEDRTLTEIGSAVAIDLSIYCSDPDGDSLTYDDETSSDPAVATVNISGSTLTITPVARGTTTVEVTVKNSGGVVIAVPSFDVTVEPNEPPTCDIPNRTLAEIGSFVDISLSQYCSDDDGDSLTYDDETSSDADVATVNISGSTLTITPLAEGTTTVEVTVSDGVASTTPSFDVTVEPNSPPTCDISDRTLTEGDSAFAIDLSSYCSDPDGDSLTYDDETSSDAAVATVNISGSTLTITPLAEGTTTVEVTVSDGVASTTPSFDVTVEPNSPPTCDIPNQTLAEIGSFVDISLSQYCSDDDGDSLTYNAFVGSGTAVSLTLSGSVLTITAEATGSAIVVVTASDGMASTSDYFTVTVGENSPPTCDISDRTLTEGDSAFAINLSSYCSDDDGDSLTYDDETSSDADVATVNISGSTLTITPLAEGTTTVEVTVSDGVASTTPSFDVTVTENSPPECDISDRTLTEGDSAFAINLSSYCSDDDGDSLTYDDETSSDAAVATVNISGSTLTITPLAEGTTTVEVTVSDGVASTTPSFDVTVEPNSPPTCDISDRTLTEIGSFVDISLSQYCSDDDGDSLTYNAFVGSGTAVSLTLSGSVLTITAEATGSAIVVVTASDGMASTSDYFTVTVGENSPPTCDISDRTLTEGDSAFAINLSSYCSDDDGDSLTYDDETSSDADVATVNISGSTLTITPLAEGTTTVEVTVSDGVASTTPSFDVTVTENSPPECDISDRTLTEGDSAFAINLSSYCSDDDGDSLTYDDETSSDAAVATVNISGSTLTITPLAEGTTTVEVTVSDGVASTTPSFDVTVEPNSPPTCDISDRTLTEIGSFVDISLSQYCSDDDGDSLTYNAFVGSGTAVSLTLSGSVLTITAEATGSAIVVVTASDGMASTSDYFTVTVGENSPPTCDISDRTLTEGDSAFAINLSSYCSDDDGDSLTYDDETSSDAAVATVNISGSTLTITPLAEGTTTVEVTVSDGVASTTPSFDVTVEPNSPPTCDISDRTLTEIGSFVDISLSQYCSDDDGDSLTYDDETSSDAAVATVNISGSTLTITPLAEGTTTVVVTVSDGVASTTPSFDVTVEPNSPPTCDISDRTLTEIGSFVDISLSQYCSDDDGDSLTYNAFVGSGTAVSLTLSGSVLTITAEATGSAIVVVTASDGMASTSDYFTVTVTP